MKSRWQVLIATAALLGGPALAEDPGHEVYTDLRSYLEELPATREVDGRRAVLRARAGVRFNRVLGQSWIADGDARVVAEHRTGSSSSGGTDAYLEIKRAYLRGEGLFGNRFLSLDAGRMRLRDDRSWLLDDDMELLRLDYDSTLLDVQIGVAGWLWDARIGGARRGRDPDEPLEAVGSRYGFATLDFQWHYRHHLGMKLLGEDYRPGGTADGRIGDSRDLILNTDLGWVAAHARGRIESHRHQLEYDLDLAVAAGAWESMALAPDRSAVGAERSRPDGALGYDLRLISRLHHNRYALGLGVAGGGSGYVQPQATGNRDRVLGLRRYRSYGEVLTPRLSNVRIASLWAGIALNNRLWLEGAVHDYRQGRASVRLDSDRSLFRPNGRSADLGRAVDLVLGGHVRADTEILISAGTFFGGSAFDGVTRDPDGYRVTAEINVRW